MKRSCLLIAFFVASLCLGSGCGNPWSNSLPNASEPASFQRVVARPPVRKALALYSTQPGRIEAYESTPLVSKISGYVEEVAVDIGDVVKKGDVLLRLAVPEMLDDLEQYRALVAQVQAEIKQSEAALSAANAEVQVATAKRLQAGAGVDAAIALKNRWESEQKRISELAALGSVTQQLADEAEKQFQTADANWMQAEAARAAADAALIQAKANVAKAEADLDAVKSRLRVAKAMLARIETMLAYATIKSPFDGVVTRRDVDTGHFVQPASDGRKPLLVVARTDLVRVFVDVPELEVPLVQGGANGDSAVIRVQALGDQEFQGRVTRTAWSLEAANRSLKTEIDIVNHDGLLRPGMYATATILLEKRNDALVLPSTAITRQGDAYFCSRVENGIIRRQRIRLGVRAGNEVEIISGIQESDLVVLANADLLEDGQRVSVAAPEAS